MPPWVMRAAGKGAHVPTLRPGLRFPRRPRGGLARGSGAPRPGVGARPPRLGAAVSSAARQPSPGAFAAPSRGSPGAAATHSPQPQDARGASPSPGPRRRAASACSPPRARGAAASLGSRPGSPNLLFSSEAPELLGVKICCNVAYHPGFAGACGSALRPAPCARCGAPGLLCRSMPAQVSSRPRAVWL